MNGWIVALASLGPASLLGTVVNAYIQRRKLRADESKTEADAAAVLADTATQLLKPLRNELRETRDELGNTRRDLRTTRAEITALRDHLDTVEGLLRQNGIPVPAFTWPRSNGERGS